MTHTIRNLYVPPGIDVNAQRKAALKGEQVILHMHSFGEECSGKGHELYENGKLNNGESTGEVS